MKISELIEELQKLHKQHGDLPCKVQTLSHYWDAPVPSPRPIDQTKKQYILLNP